MVLGGRGRGAWRCGGGGRGARVGESGRDARTCSGRVLAGVRAGGGGGKGAAGQPLPLPHTNTLTLYLHLLTFIL